MYLNGAPRRLRFARKRRNRKWIVIGVSAFFTFAAFNIFAAALRLQAPPEIGPGGYESGYIETFAYSYKFAFLPESDEPAYLIGFAEMSELIESSFDELLELRLTISDGEPVYMALVRGAESRLYFDAVTGDYRGER